MRAAVLKVIVGAFFMSPVWYPLSSAAAQQVAAAWFGSVEEEPPMVLFFDAEGNFQTLNDLRGSSWMITRMHFYAGADLVPDEYDFTLNRTGDSTNEEGEIRFGAERLTPAQLQSYGAQGLLP